MGSLNLVVPLVMWGREAPTHDISCVLFTHDCHTVVTGSRDGQMCVWDFDPPTLKLTPRCLLVGHTASVVCLAQGGNARGTSFVVSSSENGEMCTWDLRDGRCVEVLRSANVHSSMTTYQMLNVKDVRLFCVGNYPEILVYDPHTLDVLFSLAARIQPDWISALHILRPPRRNDEVVLGVTTGGWVKVWTVSEREVRPREPIYEHESKMIHSLNALCLVCCTYNQRTVLIVSQDDWQIYDAGDFSQLCRVGATAGDRWMGGDFLSADRVIVWTDMGRAYIYKLPTNCIVESRAFHNKQVEGDNPLMYGVVQPQNEEHLVNAPSWQFMMIPLESGAEKLLLRGDCEGQVMLWRLADVSEQQLQQISQAHPFQPLIFSPTLNHSMMKAWVAMIPPPIGVLDQLEGEKNPPRITASLFLPLQGRLACGREDGSIILVPATETIMLHLLHGKHHQYHNWAQPMVLRGHQGRVNCLLYPHGESPRYDMAHLVSGGIDFSIIVWDMYTGNLIHRFVVQAGQILQLLVPPPTCTPRIQNCICSVSEDHSVALLSIKERKLVLLASKHLYPVLNVKWRPEHDFLMVATHDGSVYVWQMETGHLDRVLQGVTAEEVLGACDEHSTAPGSGSGGAGSDTGLANPAVHLFRGLRHRNLAAIRHAAQRGIQQVLGEQNNYQDIHDSSKMRTCPLMIQGLRTNKQDANSHVLFFDIEALIVQLLSDEYTLMSPGTLEANELIMSSQYQRMNVLTHPASPEAAKKIAEFFGKVKDKAGEMEKKMKEKDKHDEAQLSPSKFHNILGRAKDKATNMEKKIRERDQQGLLSRVKESAESVQNLIQNKVEQSGFRPTTLSSAKDGSGSGRVQIPRHLDVTAQTLQIGQMLMSLLHSWGLDGSLDQTCENILGLLKPRVPVSYGLISKSGYMSLFMPTWHPVREAEMPQINLPPDLAAELPPEMVKLEHRTQVFTGRGHWEVSPALTTHHLLALVSVANTLQDMNAATLIPEQERRRKNHIQSSRANQSVTNHEDEFSRQQSVIKQGWSTLTALHTVLLPDCVVAAGAPTYQPPMVEILARRWQDRCQEVREAAQALLKTELSRMGPEGRQKLIEIWSPHLPTHTEPLPTGPTNYNNQETPHPPRPEHPATKTTSGTPSVNATVNGTSGNSSSGGTTSERTMEPHPHLDEDHYDEEMDAGETCREVVAQSEGRRKQATAIILLGVIGAYHGQDSAEGFGLGNLAMQTSKALAYLVLAPAGPKLPAHTPLRRAAIDLIGRGFPVWEPYLDVAKVLLALLDFCADTDRLAPSMKYGLPLIPEADSCRTASNALTLIAEARPPAFITTMAREVARFNALQQNAQSLQLNIHNTVLHRAKTEILRVMEYLIVHKRCHIMDLMVEVMDIVLHCVDPGHLKSRGLNEVFPSICGFPQVSHCPHTRRIATGAKNGSIAMYELRAYKCQMIPAHATAVTALSFSPDGKYLASCSMGENKLSFWQTSSGMFGLGASQTKCTKTYSTVPVPDIVRMNPHRLPKLVWISNKTVVHMMADGTEHRFNA
ncbi:WD repeat-containing protein 7-like isoform X3 [Homarus americanus]|uniref:WD repeat-containing protein 7-like isoform X3 n=1 Tax=Homarus americanus TaxID=6706 RepID=UPI001C47CD73|nr:WD repeat-containing protein 7-like isoform X3 [Homarus americanus]